MDLEQFTSDISSGALLAAAAGLYILSITALLILESRKPQSTFARLFVLCLFPASGLSFAAVATAAHERYAAVSKVVGRGFSDALRRHFAGNARAIAELHDIAYELQHQAQIKANSEWRARTIPREEIFGHIQGSESEDAMKLSHKLLRADSNAPQTVCH
jgi:hypothetical protein